MGTNVFKRGLETGYPLELWNVERPDEITALHASFIETGSQLVLTNSFCDTTPKHVAAMAAALAGASSRSFAEVAPRLRSARRGRIFRHRRPVRTMPRRFCPLATTAHVIEACCGLWVIFAYCARFCRPAVAVAVSAMKSGWLFPINLSCRS